MANGVTGKLVDTAGNTHLISPTAFATCNTAEGTAAKVATLTGSETLSLIKGMIVWVEFGYGNTASSPTLNIGGSGAQVLRGPTSGGSWSASDNWGAGEILAVEYDGVGDWEIISKTYSKATRTSDGLMPKNYFTGIDAGDKNLLKTAGFSIPANSLSNSFTIDAAGYPTGSHQNFEIIGAFARDESGNEVIVDYMIEDANGSSNQKITATRAVADNTSIKIQAILMADFSA